MTAASADSQHGRRGTWPAAEGGSAEERAGWLAPLAAGLAEALPRLYGEAAEPLVQELILALARGLGQGVLDLPLSGPAPEGLSEAAWPQGYRQALAGSRLCRDPDGPLVLEADTVAWRRWREQRDAVLADLLARAARPPVWADLPAGQDSAGEPCSQSADPPPPLGPELHGRQLQAVAALRGHGLLLLEGGPGTGKTSTVRGLLAEVLRHHPQARIQLAAPTGKAAARLRSACGGGFACTTLHRLLESRGDHFARHRERPLVLDLLVVDEVSMVDQALMAALLAALPPSCQLVLVGDGAQLPPIAPGAVLLQLQQPQVRRQLGSAAVTLTHTYRNAGCIASVASRLRAGLTEEGEPFTEIRPLLAALGPDDNLAWLEADPGAAPAAALEAAQQHLQRLADLAQRWGQASAEARGPLQRQLLQERDRLLLLTPRRRGRWGVEGLHQRLLAELATAPPQQWPSGTPVLCCRNLPELQLANGDLGVLVGPEAEPRQRRLLFDGPGEGEEPLLLHPALLSGAVEPALALTVHKAQGSEAETVIVLVPAGEPPDGRLLYTALTRARQRALLITARQAELSERSD